MSKLRIYTVHVRPDIPAPYESPVFVREGFSFWAFLFGPFWTFYKKLWWPTISVMSAWMFINLAGEAIGFNEKSIEFLLFGLQLVIGYAAHDWQREGLRKQGYIIADIVSGDNVMRAEQRFFDRYFAVPVPA